MKKITWRLANRPTPDEVKTLHEAGLLTKDEAREILFTETDEKERDVKSLESEIKFLRELVEKLSNGSQSRIIEIIKTVQVPYIQQPWYYPYTVWCGGITGGSAGITNAVYTGGNANYTSIGNAMNCATSGSTGSLTSGASNFSAIKTF
jgi:hypothetical protein